MRKYNKDYWNGGILAGYGARCKCPEFQEWHETGVGALSARNFRIGRGFVVLILFFLTPLISLKKVNSTEV